MKYRDLPTTPRYGVALWCPACDATFSACRGDYFHSLDKQATHCGCRMVLIQKRVKYIRISAKHAGAI